MDLNGLVLQLDFSWKGLPCYPDRQESAIFSSVLLAFPLSLVPPPSLGGSAAALESAWVVHAVLSPDLAGFPSLGKDISLELPPGSDGEGSTF